MSRLSAASVFRVAGVAALATAAAENAGRVLASRFAGRPLQYGVEMVWMTPASDALLFVAFVGVAVLAGRVSPSRWRSHVVLAIILFPAWLSVALFIPRIHLGAQVILALGLSIRIGQGSGTAVRPRGTRCRARSTGAYRGDGGCGRRG